MTTPYLYSRNATTYTPTDAGTSPWHPQLLHGGTATGLLGHAVDTLVPPGFQCQRITMDLVRPVPKAPLTVSAQVARDGKRLKVVEVDVQHEGRTVCRAAAVLVRTQDVVLPDYAPRPQPAPRGPDGITLFSIQDYLDAKGLAIPRGLHSLVQVAEITPWNESGRGVCWLRLPLTVEEGVPLTPLVRACLLSDLGNGVAQLNLGNGIGMINADVTLALHRLPQGEWLCFDSEAQVSPQGVGIVQSRLFDTQGAVGHVLQAVMTNREFGA